MDDFSEVIVSRIPIKIPGDLKRLLRDIDPGLGLMQLCNDVWIARCPIGQHRDKTADDLITFGAVLLNDVEHGLIYNNTFYELPVGTLYRIDGREPHGTVRYSYPYDNYNFAFLAWDMPKTYTAFEFRMEVEKELLGKTDDIYNFLECRNQTGIGSM